MYIWVRARMKSVDVVLFAKFLDTKSVSVHVFLKLMVSKSCFGEIYASRV